MTDTPWQDRLLARLVDHERDRGPAPREGLPSLPPRFRVVREIARGGWGIVLEAHDAVLGRTVALKILPPDRVARLGDRFVNEAQVAARLEHPAIVPVYDLGRGPDGAWLCMRLVQGEPLSEVLERLAKGQALTCASWPLERMVDAVLRVAEAVAYAHSQGVIHRDIKPGNVLTGRFGEVFLADFGLAKYLGERPEDAVELSATHAGVVMGTPGFMPPEQFAGAPDLDAKVDVYALGALLYNVLTLTVPELDPAQIVPPQRAAPPGRLVPEPLAAVAARCLEADPAARYPSVVELVDDLRAWREGRPLSVWEEPW
ncbi:MAG: serine/threonine protein kinase, partial [Planctomycetes bacterium]|nr:serine/threonine protein kinase [Planctomycetota bacterium]